MKKLLCAAVCTVMCAVTASAAETPALKVGFDGQDKVSVASHSIPAVWPLSAAVSVEGAESGKCIVAVYDMDGNMKNVRIGDVTDESISMEDAGTEGTMKVFLLNDTNEIVPLDKAYEFKQMYTFDDIADLDIFTTATGLIPTVETEDNGNKYLKMTNKVKYTVTTYFNIANLPKTHDYKVSFKYKLSEPTGYTHTMSMVYDNGTTNGIWPDQIDQKKFSNVNSTEWETAEFMIYSKSGRDITKNGKTKTYYPTKLAIALENSSGAANKDGSNYVYIDDLKLEIADEAAE